MEKRLPIPSPLNISIVLVPKELIFSKTFCWEPFPIATTQTMEAIPIIIPSIVKSERILWAIIADTDILKDSKNWSFATWNLFFFKLFILFLSSCNSFFISLCLVSLKISPSFISIILFAWLAIPLSWVTKIIVWPSSCNWFKIFITIIPLLESSAPVGSSAKMISPPFIKALAIETLCCCPPDNWLGLFFNLLESSNFSNNFFALSILLSWSTPAYIAGKATFSCAFNEDNKWYLWKIKPNFLFLSSDSSSGVKSLISSPSI